MPYKQKEKALPVPNSLQSKDEMQDSRIMQIIQEKRRQTARQTIVSLA